MDSGTITFSTELDNSQLEKDLDLAGREIENLEKKLEKKESRRNAVVDSLVEAREEIARTEGMIESLKDRMRELGEAAASGAISQPEADAKMGVVSAELERQEALYDKQLDKAVKLAENSNKLCAEHDRLVGELDAARGRYAALASESQRMASSADGAAKRAGGAIRARFASAAESARSSLARAAEGSIAPWERFSKRVNTMMKKVFVFSVILAGLRAVKSALSDMLGGNEKFASSIENLKAVLKGFLAQAVATVLPALTAFVNTVAGILERLASLVDAVFGTNIAGFIQQQRDAASAAAEMADAEGDQAGAARDLARQQEKANRQLMAFDEINAMSESGTVEPEDTGWHSPAAASAAASAAAGIADDFGMFQGVLDWLDKLRDRIANDVEGPFARVREGLQMIGKGWDEVVRGVQTGDWALVWAGVVDIAVGSLYVVEGAFGAFLDWLDEVTGGRFHDVFEGMKLSVHGAVEFIEGVLRGDLPLALQGLNDFVAGLALMVVGSFNSTIEGMIGFITSFCDEARRRWNEFIDRLCERFPQFKDAFEALRIFVTGGIDTLQGFLVGALHAVQNIVGGAVDGIAQLFSGLFQVIAGLFSGNTDMVANGVKAMLNGVITVFEGVINGLIQGAVDFLNGIISAANKIPGVSIGYASAPSISLPRLATGAVIPPNREFLAVLGDQRRGMNIEAPEDLIRQIVREESGGVNTQDAVQAGVIAALMQLMPTLQSTLGGDVYAELKLDGDTLAGQVNERNGSYARRGLLGTQPGY